MSFDCNRQVEEIANNSEVMSEIKLHYKKLEVEFDKIIEELYDFKKNNSIEDYKLKIGTVWFDMSDEMREYMALCAGAFTLTEFLYFVEGIMYEKKMEDNNG